ncbi:hypothetical protein AAFM48_22170 [Burkholderia pseudomallei]
MGTVFDAPVLSALAERLRSGEHGGPAADTAGATRRKNRAVAGAATALWFLTQLEGVSRRTMSGAVRLDGPLNREVLQRALNRIVMRHEALRTCFSSGRVNRSR